MSEENRKATVADSAVLSEVIRVSVKLDEMKRDFGNELLQHRETLRLYGSRIDAIEINQKRNDEKTRLAMKSASELSEHVHTNDAVVRVAFDKMSERIGGVDQKVVAMAAEQTPLIREIREEQVAKAARDKYNAELAVKAAEGKRESERLSRIKHERRKTYWGIAIAILGIVVPAIASYLGTRQANSDSPPHSAAVDGGQNH